MLRTLLAAPAALLLCAPAGAQSSAPPDTRALVQTYEADRGALERRYPDTMSTRRRARMRAFYERSLADWDALDFEALDVGGRIDWLLLRNDARRALAALELEEQKDQDVAELLPFAPTIVALIEARRDGAPLDSAEAARRLEELRGALAAATRALGEDELVRYTAVQAQRALDRLRGLERSLEDWFEFRDGYDPLFSWWTRAPHGEVLEELEAYRRAIDKRLIHAGDDLDATLIGDPIGADALARELAFELIPYTPAELLAIANRELAWCDARMAEAAAELGFGDDWRVAQDSVKADFVEPGRQPELIRTLAEEAVAFLRERDLVTIPPLAEETWRMEMMSPERQRTSPYFLGGETIWVSYPTEEMTQPEKLMSMRGNNVHFARATVHHELIPGHHLQQFMQRRHEPHRRGFSTPFWTEGWALYWEMRLWDLGFPRSAADRIGMLFWRKHRCARILFSLRFHMGEMSGPEAVDFLVERVGHERKNAEAEVRRSVGGDYGPLYQAAYMLGGLQILALHGELVGGAAAEAARLGERDFHDAVLRQNAIPIELVRAALTGRRLPRDFATGWRFADG